MTPAQTAQPGPHRPARRLFQRSLPVPVLALVAGLTVALLTGCSRPAPGAPAVAASAPLLPPAPSAPPHPADSPAPPPAATSAAPPAAVTAASAPPLAQGKADAPAPNTSATQPAAPLPPAIVIFQKQRDACDHFRGEEPYDQQRAAFLKAQLAKTCKGSDRALAALRQRFARHPEALAALKDYEDRIE